MLPGLQQFIRERQDLMNVSPATIQWYTRGFKWLPSEAPSQDELNDAVMPMRRKGLKATGCKIRQMKEADGCVLSIGRRSSGNTESNPLV